MPAPAAKAEARIAFALGVGPGYQETCRIGSYRGPWLHESTRENQMSLGLRIGGLMLMASTAVLAGCEKGKGTSDTDGALGPRPAKTPKEAVVNMIKSIEENDKELFIRSVTVPDRELAEAAFESIFAGADFIKEYERAYGRDAAAKAGFGRMPSSADVAENVKITTDGDDTFARFSDRTPPTRVVRVNGEWKVEPPGKGPKPEDRQGFLKASRAIVKALNEAKSKIGREGYDAEKVLRETVEAFAEILVPGL